MSTRRSPHALRQQRVRDAHYNKLVRRGSTPDRGDGLFALDDFEVGEEVCTYRGVILPKTDHDEDNPYAVNLDGIGRLCPDVNSVGGHLANHSCNANTDWNMTREMNLMSVVALKPIRAGEEITSYYGCANGELYDIACLCGSTYCAGEVSFLPPIRTDQKFDDDLKSRVKRHAFAAVKNRNVPAAVTIVSFFQRVMKTQDASGARRPVSGGFILRVFYELPDLTDEDIAWIGEIPRLFDERLADDLRRMRLTRAELVKRISPAQSV